MKTRISNFEKRTFLEWFLKGFNMKHHESLYLLQYITKKESVLEKIRFVDDVTLCPRAIVISTEEMNGHPFLYRKNHVYTTEPEKAFHDIRMDLEEPIYCQLNFKFRNRRAEYAAVLEENPYYKPDLSQEYGTVAQEMIDQLTQTYEKDKLYEAINKALEEGNKSQFINLTNTLNDM